MTLIARVVLSSLLWPLLPSPALGQETCGIMRQPVNTADPYYLRGRDHAIVYVPESLPSSNDLFPDPADLVCLLQKANDRWQNSCPNNRIPKLTVVLGQRPEGNTSDISISVINDSLNPALWAEENNSITFATWDGHFKWKCNPGDGVSEAKAQYYLDVTTHELGHAFGLDEDGDVCRRDPGTEPWRSIMHQTPTQGFPPHVIRPGHCQTIEDLLRSLEPAVVGGSAWAGKRPRLCIIVRELQAGCLQQEL